MRRHTLELLISGGIALSFAIWLLVSTFIAKGCDPGLEIVAGSLSGMFTALFVSLHALSHLTQAGHDKTDKRELLKMR